MNRAFLGLGGNLGDRLENLYLVRKALNNSCGQVLQASGIYETAAWGYNSSNVYLNQVVELETRLDPKELLKTIRNIEQQYGRERQGNSYSDRTVDIDLLFYNQDVLDQEDLKIPHPRLTERRFVLLPLMEIAPELVHPVLQKNIKALNGLCPDDSEVSLALGKKSPAYICIEGNIGSGKSTLGRILATHVKAQYLPEDYEHLALLPKFYAEPFHYAFALEFTFLLSRFEQLSRGVTPSSGRIVSDYSIYKSLCFARVNLTGAELSLFEKQFELLGKELPQPGLLIHLNTGIEQLLKNIKSRSRPFEKKITENYLRQVQDSYWNCFQDLKQIPQLVIDVERYHAGLESEHLLRIDRFLIENFADAM